MVDVDLVVERDPAAAARSLARSHGGAPFPLSERHGAWRVVRDGHTVDITASHGAVADDLGRRDFTINAMAVPLAGGDLLDPHGGRADLEARRLRAVSEQVFSDDPLRLLRLVRLAHELGFTVDPDSERLARRDAHLADRPSGERVLTEIRRLLEPDHPDAGIRLLDRIGVLDVVLPEAAAMRGVEQSPFHHLDVFEHTLQVLDAAADIAAHPQHYLREAAAPVRGGARRRRRERLHRAHRPAPGGALPRHREAGDTGGGRRRARELHGPRPPRRRHGRGACSAAGRPPTP